MQRARDELARSGQRCNLASRRTRTGRSAVSRRIKWPISAASPVCWTVITPSSVRSVTFP
jgi:hypothetical protein